MSSSSTPSEFIQCEGVAPDGASRGCFFISREYLDFLVKSGNSQKLTEAALVEDVLRSPIGIWQGLRRSRTKSAICYVGKPDHTRYDGKEIPAPPNLVFAVYVAGEQMRDGAFRIIKWGWILEHLQEAGSPLDHETAFEKQLWPAS